MKTLLTFTGFHDPYAVGLVGQEEQPGPILSLVSVRSFDRIILLATPGVEKQTNATKEALQLLHPELAVEVRDLVLLDPTDYLAILRGLRSHIRETCEDHAGRYGADGSTARSCRRPSRYQKSIGNRRRTCAFERADSHSG